MTIFPTVHLNGTSSRDLLIQYSAARQAIEVALKALLEASPNGRDYYPQGPMAMLRAQDQHRAWYQSIDKVRKDIETIEFALIGNALYT